MNSDATTSHRLIFAERLRAARRARGFRTAKSFALELGIEQNTYSRYERGDVEPNIGLLERIWLVLRLPTNDLFGALAFPVGVLEPGRPVAESMGAPRALPPVTQSEVLAWRIAETNLQSLPFNGAPPEHFLALQHAGRVYVALLQNPFGTIARLASDPEVVKWPLPIRQELALRVTAYTATLTGGLKPTPRSV